MKNSEMISALRRGLLQSQPWLVGLLLAGISALSLTGYEFGRSHFIFPALLFIAMALLACFRVRPFISSGVSLALALYLVVLVASTAVFHPDLMNHYFLNIVIMFALTWMPFALGVLRPDAFCNTRPLLLGLALLEAALVLQTVYSYLTGWGEVIEMRDGMRRACGAAGDGFTNVLVLLFTINLLRQKWFRAALIIATLMLNGAKLGLGLVLIGTLLALPVWKFQMKSILSSCFVLILGLGIGYGVIMSYPYLSPILPNYGGQTKFSLMSQDALRNYLQAGTAATGLGRIITAGAGLTEFSQEPLRGVGLGRSDEPTIFQNAVIDDFFGLKDRYNLPLNRFTVEKAIGNQLVITAAELGLPGLIAFLLLCLAAVLMAWRVYLQACAHKAAPLAAAASIWIILLIVFNQTAPWLEGASAPTLMLSICLGICASLRQKSAS